mgnify:CR=1 FL=1
MSAKHPVIAVTGSSGAGTTTKRLFAEENRIERCENVKDVEQYISRVEEMIERKEKLLSDVQ